MSRNDTRFRIERSLNRWEIVDPVTGKSLCHASTWELAVKAAKEIESAQADAAVSISTFREVLRTDHLRRVLEARAI